MKAGFLCPKASMPISVITLDGNSVNVVSLPATPALASVTFNFIDAVSVVTSVFTGQVQSQSWPGADALSGTCEYAPLTQAQADPIIAALMQCRGMSNAFQIGDPLKAKPRGTALGSPVVTLTPPSGMPALIAGSIYLYTVGWAHSSVGLLLAGDYIQIGFRLHRVMDSVVSDSSGNATIEVYPSLREVPTSGEIVQTSNCLGLFRRAANTGTWSADADGLTHISFKVQEYR
jgi:hypothetical protein